MIGYAKIVYMIWLNPSQAKEKRVIILTVYEGIRRSQNRMNRHKAREKAFQVLFQLDINETELEDVMETLKEKERNDVFLRSLVEGVIQHKIVIDGKISAHLEKWTIDRIASVERTILRMAILEIMYIDDIPQNVSINEAIELAHTFGDEQSGKFVNGVLSKIIA